MAMSQTASGVIVPNGGDSIYCISTKDAKFPYTGYYVLDYALQFSAQLKDVRTFESLEDFLGRLEKLLEKNAPYALDSWRSFRASIGDKSLLNTVDRQWAGVTRPLRNVPDEYVQRIPPNCQMNERYERCHGSQKCHGFYRQTVVRKRLSSLVRYEYDSWLVDEYFQAASLLQITTLLTHEWLWDFYDAGSDKGVQPAHHIRQANRFLHSLQADTVTAKEFGCAVFKRACSL